MYNKIYFPSYFYLLNHKKGGCSELPVEAGWSFEGAPQLRSILHQLDISSLLYKIKSDSVKGGNGSRNIQYELFSIVRTEKLLVMGNIVKQKLLVTSSYD